VYSRLDRQNAKGKKHVTKLYISLVRGLRDKRGQDMVEYALLAGFIAVAAGALLPGISTSIRTIFSKMASVVSGAAAK
jgi:Flp pilus assembly pilin Flp